jgi:lysophospholipase L1-like esterase
MKLTDQQLASAVSGAVRTWEGEDGFHVCRFTQTQTDAYQIRREDFHRKALSSSGIVIRFRTDSPFLKLAVTVFSGSSRKYFGLDLVVDGHYVESLKNFKNPTFGTNYVTMEASLGDFSKVFDLGAGEKEVALYLPWSVGCVITGLELADGASFIPVKREKKLLAFGDSITQGYDALLPHKKYITRLADRLGMEEINKAIGGEIFWPELPLLAEDFQPDLITVAYGTNDWSNRPCAEFQTASRAFFENLRKTYPHAPIVALTPIWRKDSIRKSRDYESIHQAETLIRQAVEGLPDITVLRGWELVPQEETLFADLNLHPNDDGFDHYFDNLIRCFPD